MTPTKENKSGEQTEPQQFSGKIEKLNFHDAQIAYVYYKETGKEQQLVKVIERMIALCPDHTILDALLIELADIRFAQANYDEAERLYLQHKILYPGSPHIDYISAQHLESIFKQILDAARDQKRTETLIDHAQKFLARFPEDNKYYSRIARIEQECRYLLVASELNRIAFYLQKYTYTQSEKALKAAQKRLIHLKENLLSHIKHHDVDALQKEITQTFEDDKELKLTPEIFEPFLQKITKLINTFHARPSKKNKSMRNRF